jgi:uncharacterized protein (UPF0264 family)
VTKLLVSVRNIAEAEAALAGGADVIDVKEPRRGALGPADPEVWEQIRTLIGRRAVVSAALGELLSDPVEALARRTAGLRFAKIGLAGCQAERGWVARWLAMTRALPPRVAAVPVAYADWAAADAPAPSVALTLASHLPARLLLVDTFDKASGTLLAAICRESLLELVDYARQLHVRIALAGSLDAAAIEELLPLAPAYIGVRGAACRGGRSGTIEIARVKSLARLVQGRREMAPG